MKNILNKFIYFINNKNLIINLILFKLMIKINKKTPAIHKNVLYVINKNN